MAKHEVVKTEPVEAAVVSINNEIPDYLRGGGGRGNENVGQKDLTIPRIQIVQDLSPELDADNAEKFISGAQKGDLFNSLTREIYTGGLYVVNVDYHLEWNVFVLRKRGGGFRGTYPNEVEARKAIMASDHPEDMEAIETAIHYVLVLDKNGIPVGEAAIPMKSTQLSKSRNWNSMIRLRGAGLDRFAGTWHLSTIKQKKDQYTFFNFATSPGPWASKEAFQTAEGFFEAISSGAKTIDRSDLQDVAVEGTTVHDDGAF